MKICSVCSMPMPASSARSIGACRTPNRRVAWIAWGALGLATIPVVSTSHSDPHAVLALAVWIPLCVAAFAFVATVWRRHMLATTPTDGDERLPWG